MAWARLGVVEENAGHHSESTKDFTRAFDLSKNVSERERLYIDGHFYNAVSGNLDKEVETLELAIKTYPLINDNYTNLGVVQGHLGRMEDSAAAYLKGLEADPSDTVTRENLMYAYLDLDRVQDAAKTAAEIQRLHNDQGTTYLIFYYELQFFQGNTAGMAQTVARAEGRPDQMQLTQAVAFLAEYNGQYHAADAAWSDAQRQAVTQKAPDARASFLLYHVSGRAIAGSCDSAAQDVRSALALDKTKTTLVQAVYTAALCGDRADASPLIASLARAYPEDTLVQKITLPQSRAALALADHQPAAALRELEGSAPFDLTLRRRLPPRPRLPPAQRRPPRRRSLPAGFPLQGHLPRHRPAGLRPGSPRSRPARTSSPATNPPQKRPTKTSSPSGNQLTPTWPNSSPQSRNTPRYSSPPLGPRYFALNPQRHT